MPQHTPHAKPLVLLVYQLHHQGNRFAQFVHFHWSAVVYRYENLIVVLRLYFIRMLTFENLLFQKLPFCSSRDQTDVFFCSKCLLVYFLSHLVGIVYMVQERQEQTFRNFVLQFSLFAAHLINVERLMVVIVFQSREIQVDVFLASRVCRIFLYCHFGESPSLLVCNISSADIVYLSEMIHQIA